MIPTTDPRFKTGYLTTDTRKAFTPACVAMYPALLAPTLKYKSKTDYEYKLTCVFEPGTDTSILQQLAINAAIADGWGADPSQWPAGWNKNPLFREQNTKNKEGFSKVAGAKFFDAAAKVDYPPIVFDHNGAPITDPKALYTGMIGWALVHAYTYGKPGDANLGLKFGLDGFQLLAPGKRLGPDNAAHFGAVAVPAATIAVPAGAAVAPATNAFG